MKIDGTLVILTPGFAASENDTTCLPMQQSLVRTFTEVYPQIKIIILSFQYPYATKKYSWFNATVYSFNGKNRGGIRRLLLRRKINKVLMEIYRSEKIIGLLSFWFGECAAVGKLFGKKYCISHYCWLLGQDVRKGNKYPKQYALSSANLIALSDFLQKIFEKNYAVKPAHVIPPGINAKHVNLQPLSRDVDLLAVGSLIPLKQYEKLIAIVAEMKKVVPAIKTVLIGDGPEKQKLQHLIAEHSLEENIFLAGELTHPDVTRFMQRAKIFLHPSFYEGFGVVCLEALYCGAHVISFAKPMNQEIENWHIAKNAQAMLLKATEILLNPSSTYQSKLVFSMEDSVKKMLQLFVPQEV